MNRIIRNEQKFLEYYEGVFFALHFAGMIVPVIKNDPARPIALESQAKVALNTGWWDVMALSFTGANAVNAVGKLNVGICPKCGEYPIGREVSWPYSYTWHNGPKLFLCKSCYDVGDQRNANKSRHVRQNRGCYIATVCYGSPTDERVVTLKFYRDNILSKHLFGKGAIYFYYIFSPYLAKLLQHKPKLNSIVEKYILRPMVNHINRKYK